jgi:DNA-binding XRE family transcriptional regulator
LNLLKISSTGSNVKPMFPEDDACLGKRLAGRKKTRKPVSRKALGTHPNFTETPLMAPTIGPVLPSAFKALYSVLRWDQGEFARALGVSRTTLFRIETGISEMSEDQVERAKAILEVTPEEFEAAAHWVTLIFNRLNSGAAPLAPDSRRGRLARQFEAVVRDARAFLESKIHEIEVEEAKEEAEQLWQELATRPQKERILRVETCDEFLTPAFIARLCDESVKAAAKRAADDAATVALAREAARCICRLPRRS